MSKMPDDVLETLAFKVAKQRLNRIYYYSGWIVMFVVELIYFEFNQISNFMFEITDIVRSNSLSIFTVTWIILIIIIMFSLMLFTFGPINYSPKQNVLKNSIEQHPISIKRILLIGAFSSMIGGIMSQILSQYSFLLIILFGSIFLFIYSLNFASKLRKINRELKQREEARIKNFNDIAIISIGDLDLHIINLKKSFKHLSISLVIVFHNINLISGIPQDNWKTNPMIFIYFLSALLSPLIYIILILNFRKSRSPTQLSDKFMMLQLFHLTRSSKQLNMWRMLMSSFLHTFIIIASIFVNFLILLISNDVFETLGSIIWLVITITGSLIFGFSLYYTLNRIGNFERSLLEYGKTKLEESKSNKFTTDSIPEGLRKEFDNYNINWVS